MTPLPLAPSTLRPETFANEMDDFLAALPVFQSELDAIGTVAGLSLSSSSTTSLTIGTGTQVLTVDAGKGFITGLDVTVANSATQRMLGTVSSYVGTTLTVEVNTINGSGTYAAWSIGPALAVDTSTFATLTGTQTLTNKTLTTPTLDGAATETPFVITDSGSVSINPANGAIQTWTLGASRTPTASFVDGQSVTLLIDDGSAFSITWTSIAPVWLSTSGVAPTLKTTGYTLIVLFKVGGTVYGVA